MNKKSYISPFTGGKAMKRIIAATVTTLLLCSGSAAHAQTAAAPPAAAPQAAAGSSAAADQGPPIDVSKLAPNQREYLITALISQNPSVVPEQVTKFKDIYEKMAQPQQEQMIEQVAAQIPHLPKETRDKIMNNMPPPKQ
jgi:hypothetical protein